MTSACVVIPIYKPRLDSLEAIALQQCVKTLAAHPLTLLKPASLDLRALRNEYPSLREEAFEDGFFSSVRSYNTLMLSRAFYERFAPYEYILIHQLDAFVFRDELSAWCARGYDYVGAPWLPDKVFRSRANRWRLQLRHWLQEQFPRDDRRPLVAPDAPLYFRVGNGGFSLRRVAAMQSVIDALPDRVDAALKAEPPVHEDIFFSIEANRGVQRLRIPGYRVAARFAVELNPRSSIDWLNAGQLPFGCHGWDRADPEFWKGLFRGLGYRI